MRRMRGKTLLGWLASWALLALGVPASSWAAQEPTADPSSKPKHALCWRGKPLPECGSFIITELGVYGRVDDDPTGANETPSYFTLDLGYARNNSPRSAVGATLYGGTGSNHARLGLRVRYRRWLSRNASVDFAPGVLVYGSEDGLYQFQAPGFLAGVTLNWRDWLAISLEAEHDEYERISDSVFLQDRPEKVSDTTWRLGGKLGSSLGFIGAAALVGLFLYFIATFAGS